MRFYEFKQTLNEYSDLEQEKEEIIAKISGLTASNPDEAELLDRIYKLLNKSQIGTNIEAAFNSTLGDEQFNPAELKKVKQEITKIIASVETDYKSLNAFIKYLIGLCDTAVCTFPLLPSIYISLRKLESFGCIIGSAT